MKPLTRHLSVVTVLLALGASALNSPAQAITPPAPPAEVVPTNGAVKATALLDDLKHLGSDAWGALKGANFQNGIVVEPFGLYHKSDFGGGLAVATAGTNGVNVGFAVAAINNRAGKRWDFYDATLSLQLGKQVTVPVLNLPAFLYVEAGPALNLAHPNTILEQSVAGAKIFFGRNRGSVGVGIGQNSEWTEPFYVLHASWKF